MRKILSQRKGLYLHRQSRKYPGTGLQVPGHGQLGGKEMSILAQTEAAAGFSIIWILVMLVALYFMMIRPQQKENKRKNAMLAELAVGDTVLTTSGFYGMVIDITEDTIIVEFGNNKNCRIPMQKSAISMVEKPEDAVEKENK